MISSIKLKKELQQLQLLHLAAAQKATYILKLTEGVSTSSKNQKIQAMTNNAVAKREYHIMKKVAGKATVLLLIIFASCKTIMPNAPALPGGKAYNYKVTAVAKKNGKTIARVKGFKHWQIVSDTVKKGDLIPVIKVRP